MAVDRTARESVADAQRALDQSHATQRPRRVDGSSMSPAEEAEYKARGTRPGQSSRGDGHKPIAGVGNLRPTFNNQPPPKQHKRKGKAK